MGTLTIPTVTYMCFCTHNFYTYALHMSPILFYFTSKGKDHHEGISLSNATAKTKTLQSQQPSILCVIQQKWQRFSMLPFLSLFYNFFSQFPSALTSGIAARVWAGLHPAWCRELPW